MTICTNLDSKWVLQKLQETFGQMQSVPLGNIVISPPHKPKGIVTVNTPMEKEQVYIYMGYPTIGINHPDYQALKVATDILSSRLGLQLREVQGLAYSVGSGLSSAPDFGWFLVTMGTGKDNFQLARDGILAEISRLRTEPVSQTELRRAQNSIWGSSLTSQLSRINQAYYMALYYFMGVGYDYTEQYINQIRAVTIDDVLRVARQYYSTTDYYLATVGL